MFHVPNWAAHSHFGENIDQTQVANETVMIWHEKQFHRNVSQSGCNLIPGQHPMSPDTDLQTGHRASVSDTLNIVFCTCTTDMEPLAWQFK